MPIGGRQTSWLFTKGDQGFELGTTKNKSPLWQGGGLESRTSGLQHQRPKPLGHVASSKKESGSDWKESKLDPFLDEGYFLKV